MPALPTMLEHIAETAPDCPLTDVISVKGCGPRRGESRRFAGPLRRRSPDGRHRALGLVGRRRRPVPRDAPWVVSVDEHVDPAGVVAGDGLALDCGAFVVPARTDEHDAAAAAISHLPHLAAEALAITAGEVPLAFALAAGSFRDGTRVAATAPDLVRPCVKRTPRTC